MLKTTKPEAALPIPNLRFTPLNNFVLLQNSVTSISNPSKFPLITNIIKTELQQREIAEQQGKVISLNCLLTIKEPYILEKPRVGGTSLL